MRPHSFSVGQNVELVPGRLSGHVPAGRYVVLRLLPNDGEDREYRVKNASDGHERVVRESELRGDAETPPEERATRAGAAGARERRP